MNSDSTLTRCDDSDAKASASASERKTCGTRAYWAAQAGLEWGIGTASAVADPATITMTTCSTSTPLSIGNFSVSVQCTPTVYAEAGVNKTMILLNATASLAGSTVGSIGFVERNLSATIER